MSWRETFLEYLGPAGFTGMTLGDWLRQLARNRFYVNPRYWPRAANITANSIANSVLRRWEDFRHGRRIRETNVPPPLFVLGVWRSGTTHLHNLLARDERFAFPSTFETFYPHTFLTVRRINGPLMEFAMPPTRPMDNMRMGIDEPQEDEFALCGMTGISFTLAWAFPRNPTYYRYLTLRDATPDERRRWQESLFSFVQKLTYKHGRPLVLKSPAHMGRIRLLLEIFPDAKFVHIHRHPFDVFKSTMHMARAVTKVWSLQRYEPPNEEATILRQYRDVCDAYFEERHLIPPERFHEMSYDELTSDPVAALRRTYEKLGLPEFSVFEPKLREYVASLADYKRNRFAELPLEQRDRVVREWQRCFEEWGYSRDGIECNMTQKPAETRTAGQSS
jgi:hypothetical protein